MRSEAIRPGDVIAGKYRVRTILGRSRGFLVEAFHTEFDQRVVIRVLSPALCDEKEIERFRREARTLAKLESEHVARIIDVGTLPDGAFYLVRQFLEGTDLATHLKKSGALPLQQAVLFILQASEALAQTHVHNIVLRELQPSHLFLAQRPGGSPALKIIDFGTAKLMREVAAPIAGAEATATAMFGMSPYSSPEIIRKAKNVDARTDVWSLGAILYEMLAARPAFAGEMAALMLAITKEEPVPLTSIRRDLPPELNQIIGWALAKDVDGRFANVYGFAHALLPFAPPEGQVLIQRIGEITTAAQQAKQRPVYAAPAPAAPMKGSGDEDAPTFVDAVLEESTGVKPSPGAKGSESPLDRTMFMGNDYVAPSPGPPGMSGAPKPVGAQVPGAGAPPASPYGAAAPAARPSQQQAVPPGQQQGSLLGPSLQLDAGQRRGSMQSWHDISGISGAGAASPGAPGAPPGAAKTATPQDLGFPPEKRSNKNTIILAIAGAVVGLTLLAGVVVFATGGSDTSGNTPATAESGASSAGTPTAPSAPSTPTGAQNTGDTPSAAPTSEPAASASSPSASGTPTSAPTPTQGGIPLPQVPTAKPSGTGTAPKPTSTATSPPPDSGGMGTLVAVAVGGSCAFSVNGASKGSGATIKVQLKPGSYSVSCKPVSGATKSKSVTVTSGGTAMAMFKL